MQEENRGLPIASGILNLQHALAGVAGRHRYRALPTASQL